MARSAIWKAVVSGPAGSARAADDVGFAGALSAEGIALQFSGAHEIADATQSAAVVLGGYRKHRVAAESWKTEH